MGSHFLLQEIFQNSDQTFISCIARGFFPQNHLGQLPVSYAILSLSYGGRLPEPRAVVSLGGSLLMKVSSLDYCLAFSEQFSSQKVKGVVIHVQKHQR